MINEIIKLRGDGRKITTIHLLILFHLKVSWLQSLLPPANCFCSGKFPIYPKRLLNFFLILDFENLIPVVRVYDVTDLVFNGKNAHHFFEIAVPYQNGHWFIKGLVANRSYVAELGINISQKEFFPLFRSNTIQTPMMKIPNGNDMNHDLIHLKQHEEQPPKWIDHVSTYSYYMESKNMEDING